MYLKSTKLNSNWMCKMHLISMNSWNPLKSKFKMAVSVCTQLGLFPAFCNIFKLKQNSFSHFSSSSKRNNCYCCCCYRTTLLHIMYALNKTNWESIGNQFLCNFTIVDRPCTTLLMHVTSVRRMIFTAFLLLNEWNWIKCALYRAVVDNLLDFLCVTILFEPSIPNSNSTDGLFSLIFLFSSQYRFSFELILPYFLL